MKSLLIAERFNMRHWRPIYFRSPPENYELELRLKFSTFRKGGDANLKEIGLETDQSMNLTWPDPQGEPFDKNTARDFLSQYWLVMRERWGVFVLCGRNVSRSFGVPRLSGFLSWHIMTEEPQVCKGPIDPAAIHTFSEPKVVIFPHPSGLNRWWNDPENFCLARRTANLVRSLRES